MNEIETRTIAKVTRRLVPFLMACYFVAYLDRVNVGFAALTMNADLGLSQTAFGFGAGIFFIAYFIFEVPSNLMLERFGARKWIARIMLSWGILSGAMAFIPHIASATGMGLNSTLSISSLKMSPITASGMNAMIRFSAKRRALGSVNSERATFHSFTRYSQHTARIAAP